MSKETQVVEVDTKDDETRPQDSKPEDTKDESVEAVASTPVEAKAKSGSAAAKISLLLAIITLIIVAALAYYFYDLQQKQQKLVDKQQQGLQSLKQGIESSESKISQNLGKYETHSQQLSELSERITQNEAITQQAMEALNRSQRDWVIAEVDYLLRMANQRLEIARDVRGAIAALKGADERIATLGDLRLLNIRKQLAKDIGDLSAVKQADINGISLSLDQMAKHAVNLPFVSAQNEVQQQLENTQNTSAEKSVEQPVEDVQSDSAQPGFVDSVLDTLKQIGDIKVHKRSIKAASTAEQQRQTEEKLISHLIGARLAVIRFDQQQFSYEISQIKQLLGASYDGDDSRVVEMQKRLDEFAAVNLTPELPELLKAWEMVQKEMIRASAEASLEADSAEKEIVQ